MTQKIVNGFPQYFDYTWKRSRFYGTATTQADQSKTDINLQSDTVGDPIEVTADKLPLLTIQRSGAFLHEDQGFELIAPNIIRVWPGLLESESLEFLYFTGASGVINFIPEAPPVPDANGYTQTISEALAYTDNSITAVNAHPPMVMNGKTRISTYFLLDAGRLDVYINGSRVGLSSGIWSLIDSTTIELNDDYSTTKTKVEIVKQIVG